MRSIYNVGSRINIPVLNHCRPKLVRRLISVAGDAAENAAREAAEYAARVSAHNAAQNAAKAPNAAKARNAARVAAEYAAKIAAHNATRDAAQNTARVARWSARLAHDNTFLSYHRNAIIATVAGCALIRYRKDEDRPPLDGVALLAMGALYIYVGSGLYVWQTVKLSRALHLSNMQIGWSVFNAVWPTGLWTIMLQCLVDETPTWLLESLRLADEMHGLPTALKASLFLDPPALFPVCGLLSGLQAHEQARLQAVRESTGDWRPRRLQTVAVGTGPLSKTDVATIIERRLDRLAAIASQLDVLACSERAVPTSLTAPLLDTLHTEAKLLEKVRQLLLKSASV